MGLLAANVWRKADSPPKRVRRIVLEIREEQDGVALGPLQALVGYHLRRASTVFNADFTRVLGQTGMRQVLLGILSVVAANPGINQGAAGRVLGIQRANMVSLINELIDAGLVLRRAADDDRRAFALTATAAGEEMLADCLRQIHAHESRLLANLNTKERETLIELLLRIEALED